MRKEELQTRLADYLTLVGSEPKNDRIQWLEQFLASDEVKKRGNNDHVYFSEFEKFLREDFKKKSLTQLFSKTYLDSASKSAPLFKAFMQPVRIEINARDLTAGEYKYLAEEVVINGNLPAHCHLEVPDGSLNVNGNIGADNKLTVMRNIYIHGSVGERCTITNTKGPIEIERDVQADSIITGDKINIEGIARRSTLKAKTVIIIKWFDAETHCSAPKVIKSEPDFEPEAIKFNEAIADENEDNSSDILSEELEKELALELSMEDQVDSIHSSVYETASLEKLNQPLSDKLNEPQKRFLLSLHAFLSNAKHPFHAKLKEHQINALIEYCNGLNAGIKDAVFSLATGTGKTVLFVAKSALIHQRTTELNAQKTMGNRLLAPVPSFQSQNRILVLVPSRELINQTITRYKEFAPELKVGPYSSKDKYNRWKGLDVVVTTYEQLKQRGFLENKYFVDEKTEKPFSHMFSFVVLDEAHKACGEVGVEVIRTLQRAGAACLAYSATPIYERLRPTPGMVSSCYDLLGTTLEKNPIPPFTINMAEDKGMLAPVCACVVIPTFNQQTKKELSKLGGGKHSAFGDINEEKFDRTINTEANNNMIVDLYANGANHITGKRFITDQCMVFAGGINHAEDLAMAFRRHIKIEDWPHLIARREEYVERMRKMTSPSEFDENKVRLSFCVAKAVHSGRYSVLLDRAKAQKVLQDGAVTYTDNETGNPVTYTLFPQELALLQAELNNPKKQNDNRKFRVFVKPALSEAEKQAIFTLYRNGGLLDLMGAIAVIEGVDVPPGKVAFAVFPTLSKRVHVQRCGRALRKWLEKNCDLIATIVDINYNIPGQVFFPHITNGKWQLGKIPKQAIVDHSHIPLLPIANKTATSGLLWEDQQIFSLTPLRANVKESGIRGKAQRKTSNEIEVDVDEMICAVGKSVNSIAEVVEKLDERLSKAAIIEHMLRPTTKKRARPVPSETETAVVEAQRKITFTSVAANTRGFDKSLEEITKKTNTLTNRLENIIAEIKETIYEEESAAPSGKRQKNEGEITAAKPRKLRADMEENLRGHELRTALLSLQGLQAKLKMIATGGIASYSGSTVTSVSIVGKEEGEAETNEISLEDLKFNLSKVREELQDTSTAFTVDGIVANIEHIKNTRARNEREKQAQEKAKQTQLAVAAKANAGEVLSLPSQMHEEELANKAAPKKTNVESTSLVDAKTKVIDLSTDLDFSCDNIYKLINENQIGKFRELLAKYPVLAKTNCIVKSKGSWLPALHFAVHLGHLEIVKILLKYGANIEMKDGYGQTPILSTNKRFMIDFLLDKGADGTLIHKNGKTLIFACVHMHQLSSRLINNYHLSINARDNLGDTPFHSHIRHLSDKPVLMQFLIALLQGMDPHIKNNNDKSVYDLVDDQFKLQLAPYLDVIKNKNVRPRVEKIDLSDLFSEKDTLSFFSKLVNNPELLFATNEKGETAVHLAIIKNNWDAVRLLYGAGANFNVQDKDGNTPLMHTATTIDIVNFWRVFLLTDFTIKNNLGDDIFTTPLSPFKNKVLRLEFLRYVNRILYSQIRASVAETTEFLAILKNSSTFSELELLLENNPLLAICADEEEFTPLHYLMLTSLKSDEQKIFEFMQLIEYGADPFKYNLFGKTAMDLAAPQLRDELKKRWDVWLAEHPYKTNITEVSTISISEVQSNKVNQVPTNPVTKLTGLNAGLAISGAVEDVDDQFLSFVKSNNVEGVKNYLSKITKINYLKDGYAPLHHAAMQGNIEIARLLLEKGASVNIKTADDSTCINLAKDIFMINFLIDRGALLNGLVAGLGGNILHQVSNYPPVLRKVLNIFACNVNEKNFAGKTPLHLIDMSDRDNLISFFALLIKRADPYILDTKGQPYILDTNGQNAFVSHPASLKFLEEVWKARKPSTSFTLALNPENITEFFDLLLQPGSASAIFKLLLDNPLLIRATNSRGQTALHKISDIEDPLIIPILLACAHSDSINAKDKYGYTPLLRLVTHQAKIPYELLRTMLSFGANITVKNYPGDNIFTHPTSIFNNKANQLAFMHLIQTRKKPDLLFAGNFLPQNDKKRFFDAINTLSATKVAAELEKNPFLAICEDELGATPLHYLLAKTPITGGESKRNLDWCERFIAPIYRLLIEYGASPEAKDNKGQTAFMNIREAVLRSQFEWHNHPNSKTSTTSAMEVFTSVEAASRGLKRAAETDGVNEEGQDLVGLFNLFPTDKRQKTALLSEAPLANPEQSEEDILSELNAFLDLPTNK